jgi:hypothetical protein
MALKSYSIASFDLLNLLPDESPAESPAIEGHWRESGFGTNEYYFVGGVVSLPLNLFVENVDFGLAVTVGSLTEESWGYGDNDTLGYDTVYIRFADGSDPDTLSTGDIKAYLGTPTTLLEADGVRIVIFSLLISNYSGDIDAKITIQHLDSLDNMLFKWTIDLEAGNSPFALDSMIVFADGEKLVVASTGEDVSVYASGEEK